MAITTRTQNAMERFIAKTRDLFSEEADLDRRWELLRPILAELLQAPEVQEAAEHWPECNFRDGRAENLLFYEDPDYGFAINGLTKSSSRPAGRPAHPHS